MYFLMSGTAEAVVRDTLSSARETMTRYVMGDYFGELALLSTGEASYARACDVAVTSAAVVVLKLEGGTGAWPYNRPLITMHD